MLINLSSVSLDTNSILSLLIYQQNKFQTYNQLVIATNFRLIIFPTIFAAIGLSSIQTLVVACIGYFLALLQWAWLEPYEVNSISGTTLGFGDFFCDIIFISLPFVVMVLILNNMHQAFRSQIKEVESRLANMMNITNEAIIIQSRRKKKIIYVNLAFERMFGYEHDEIIHANKNILDLLVGPPVIATDEWSQCKARTKLGDRFGVEVTHKVDFLSAKKVDVFIVRNNELNDQVKLMNEKAKKAQIELQSRTTFFSMISHDLKNPLSSIYLIATKMHEDFLHNQSVDSHEGLEWMNMILSSCHILSNIIQDILSSSKLESGNVELDVSNFDLQHSVEEIISINSVTAFKKGIDVALEIDIKRGSKHRVPVVVKGDVHKFQQILTNLMGNAIKFTHDGSVSVSVEIQEETETTVKVFVIVCDTGIGIPEEKQTDLFKVFSRLKKDKEYEGSGLGLSICKNLTTLMGGDIGCYSDGANGSNFWFTVSFQKASNGEEYDKIIEKAEKRAPLTDPNHLQEVREKLKRAYDSSSCLVLYKENKIRKILANYLRETFDDNVVAMENIDGIFQSPERVEESLEQFLHNSSSNVSEWPVKSPISLIVLDDACFLPENIPKSENMLFTAATTHSVPHPSASHQITTEPHIAPEYQATATRRSSAVIFTPVEVERIYSTMIALRKVVEKHNSILALNNNTQPQTLKLVVWFDKFEPKRFLSFKKESQDTRGDYRSTQKGPFDNIIRKPLTLFSFQTMIQNFLVMKPSAPIGSHERKAIESYSFPPKSEKRKSSTAPSIEAVSSSQEPPIQATEQTVRVLVADDNTINRSVMTKLIKDVVKGNPCVVIEAKGVTNGLEAWNLFKENFNTSARYDAIFLDVHMDVMSGLECAEKIRAHEQQFAAKQPVLLIGATGDVDAELKCKQVGMNYVCLKPFTQTDVKNIVQTIIEEVKSLRQ